MSPRTHVLPFSGEPKDWPNWSFRFEALAAQLGLLDEIEVSSPEQDATKKALTSRQAYYILVSSMKGEMAPTRGGS